MEIQKDKISTAIFNLEQGKNNSWVNRNFTNVNVLINRKEKTLNIIGVCGKESFDRTFKIGDTVEVGSYNLIYTGEIVNIGEKTIKVNDTGRVRMMKLGEFVYRNWNLDLESINKVNQNWYD